MVLSWCKRRNQCRPPLRKNMAQRFICFSNGRANDYPPQTFMMSHCAWGDQGRFWILEQPGTDKPADDSGADKN